MGQWSERAIKGRVAERERAGEYRLSGGALNPLSKGWLVLDEIVEKLAHGCARGARLSSQARAPGGI